MDTCPGCGAAEVPADTPRTTYGCGSSDYDQRPDTGRGPCFDTAVSRIAKTLENTGGAILTTESVVKFDWLSDRPTAPDYEGELAATVLSLSLVEVGSLDEFGGW